MSVFNWRLIGKNSGMHPARGNGSSACLFHAPGRIEGGAQLSFGLVLSFQGQCLLCCPADAREDCRVSCSAPVLEQGGCAEKCSGLSRLSCASPCTLALWGTMGRGVRPSVGVWWRSSSPAWLDPARGKALEPCRALLALPSAEHGMTNRGYSCKCAFHLLASS